MRIRAAVSSGCLLLSMLWVCLGFLATQANAQNSAHPDAKPVVPEKPYNSFRDAWRWDVRAQLFLNSANIISDDVRTPGRNYSERVETVLWQPRQVELVYPVVREGSFYWSPNRDVEVSIRFDDVEILNLYDRRGTLGLDGPDNPVVQLDAPYTQKFVQGTYAEYTHWESGDILGSYRQLHHTSSVPTPCSTRISLVGSPGQTPGILRSERT